MELGGDTKAVLLTAGLIFLGALVLGVWKYRQMAANPDGLAHPYVDVAHRVALLYSFASLLIAVFVELSGWSTAVNLIAAFAVIAFFVGAISGVMSTTGSLATPTTGSGMARSWRGSTPSCGR